MSDAPERIWVTFARKDKGRDPRANGSTSYIGDACDGPVDADQEYVRADALTALEAENARLRALVPHPDETDLEYILRETNRGVRIEEIAKARGITRERARLRLERARKQLVGYTPQQLAALRIACDSVLPLIDAVLEEKVTDSEDWILSVALIRAALEEGK